MLNRISKHKPKGFTLIEIILGIVVLSISLAIVSSLIAPTEEQSADNILQIKGAELAQSLLNDISSRAFDHNSDMVGGRWRCDEDGRDNCTDGDKLGPEDGLGGRIDASEDADDPNTFNDVDDFDGYEEALDAKGEAIDSTYDSFKIRVDVDYAGTDLGLDDDLAKRITVKVTTPLGTELVFSTHKVNF